MPKIILTEEQHAKVVNLILSEMIQETEVLDEGAWEKIKYGLSKLGRYKAGGKIFGKGKIDQEAAQRIQDIINKKGNEVIANLDAQIKETNPKFPNNEKEVEFLNTILSISAVYDSIVVSTQKNPDEEGYLPIDAANGVINDLREYVKKFLDVDLTAVYSVVDEIEGNTITLNEEEINELNESWAIDEYGEDSGGQDMTWGMYGRDNSNSGIGSSIDQKMMSSLNVANHIIDGLPEEYTENDVEMAVTLYISDSGINQEVANSYTKDDEWWEDLYYNINDIRRKGGTVNEAGYDFQTQAGETPQHTNVPQSKLAGLARTHLQNKRGQGDDFDSERMKTLKSNKLPLTLMGIGASLGAFNWLVNTDWFKHLFDTPFNYTDTENTTQMIQQHTQVFNDIKPGEGVYKLLGRVTNHQLNANSSTSEFIDALKQIGGGDAHKGVDLLCQDGGVMMRPQEAAKGLHELINNPTSHQNINFMFQDGTQSSGTGKLVPTNTTLYGTIAGRSLISILTKIIPQAIAKTVVKTGVKTGAGYAAAKGLGAVLGPIGIGLLAAGALVKLMRMKGQKQSRAKTLNDLYQSIRNLDGGAGIIEPQGEIVSPSSAVNGDVPRGKTGTSGSVSGDDLYNSLRNLFQFIVNNRNMLGTRSADNVGTGAAMDNQGMKAGDTYNYNGQPVTIINPKLGDGRTQVRAQNIAKNVFTVPTDSLKKMNESQLFEGQYIKDKRMVQFLNKNLSYDKLKSFEEIMRRIESLRNRIKNMKSSDKVMAGHLKSFNSNPIMATDFKKMFNLPADNPKAANSLKAFIDDIFITLYSGKYKFASMIDKMAGLGGGNINKVEEGDAYDMLNPNKAFLRDAQDRGRFKANLLKFLSNAMNLFQYLTKLKKEGKLSNATGSQGGQPQGSTPQGGQPQGPTSQGDQPKKYKGRYDYLDTYMNNGGTTRFESIENVEGQIDESVERIKKIMFG